MTHGGQISGERVTHHGLIAGLLLGLSIAVGCRGAATVAPARLDPIPAQLGLRTAERSNEGRPFHVLVRAVTRESFLADDYAAVAKLVIVPDETVLEDIVVFPGESYRVNLELDEIPEGIGVYGLYTGPEGESWKAYVEWGDDLDVFLGPASGVFAAGDILPNPRAKAETAVEGPTEPKLEGDEEGERDEEEDEEEGEEEGEEEEEPNNVLSIKAGYSHALNPEPSEDGSAPDRPVGFIVSYERVLLENWLSLEISKPFYFSAGRLDSPFEVFLKWNRRFGRFEPAIGVGAASNVRVFYNGRDTVEGVKYRLSFGVAATTALACWFGRHWGLELEVNYGYIPLADAVEHELNMALGPLFAF